MPERRWYQTLPVAGAVYEDPARRASCFWDVGKLATFIRPLLPPPARRGAFLEIGCNAGLFLHLAEEEGFRRVVGVESHGPYVEQAARYRATLPMAHYEVVRGVVGHGFDPAQFPLLDVVLLANVHYYFGIPAFVDLLDALRVRTAMLIVVSAEAHARESGPGPDLASVRGYCRDWTETGLTGPVVEPADPAPRANMFGVRFAGAIRAVPVAGLYGQWQADRRRSNRSRWRDLVVALPAFVAAVLDGQDLAVARQPYAAWWQRHHPNRPQAEIEALCTRKAALVLDLRARGQQRPIYLSRDEKVVDGLTRLVAAQHLGWQHLYARMV